MKSKKIDSHLVDYIQNVIETAKLLNIESVVIDEDSIRGQNEDGMFILQKDNLPDDMPFSAIGFGNVLSLNSRMNLFTDYSMTYEPKVQKNGYEFPFRIKLKSNTSKTSVDYTCVAPITVRAPKKSNDPISFTFTMDDNSVDMLSRSNSVMRAETVLLSAKDNKVLFQICDENSNILEHRITKKLVKVDESEYGETFAFSYKLKNILPILKYLAKQEENFEINITYRGFLQLNVNDLEVFILREKE